MEPMTCPFCSPADADIVIRNDLCYVRYDRYPVSKGHMLVIPFRHVADFFDLNEDDRNAIMALIPECKAVIESNESPDGYNIGFNIGEAAGQTVMHCHLHVIPRYKGDVKKPKGGLRGVIPQKKEY